MSLREYNQLRHVGMHLSEEIPKIYGLDEELPQIIRILGIGQGKNLILQYSGHFLALGITVWQGSASSSIILFKSGKRLT